MHFWQLEICIVEIRLYFQQLYIVNNFRKRIEQLKLTK